MGSNRQRKSGERQWGVIVGREREWNVRGGSESGERGGGVRELEQGEVRARFKREGMK